MAKEGEGMIEERTKDHIIEHIRNDDLELAESLLRKLIKEKNGVGSSNS